MFSPYSSGFDGPMKLKCMSLDENRLEVTLSMMGREYTGILVKAPSVEELQNELTVLRERLKNYDSPEQSPYDDQLPEG